MPRQGGESGGGGWRGLGGSFRRCFSSDAGFPGRGAELRRGGCRGPGPSSRRCFSSRPGVALGVRVMRAVSGGAEESWAMEDAGARPVLPSLFLLPSRAARGSGQCGLSPAMTEGNRAMEDVTDLVGPFIADSPPVRGLRSGEGDAGCPGEEGNRAAEDAKGLVGPPVVASPPVRGLRVGGRRGVSRRGGESGGGGCQGPGRSSGRCFSSHPRAALGRGGGRCGVFRAGAGGELGQDAGGLGSPLVAISPPVGAALESRRCGASRRGGDSGDGGCQGLGRSSRRCFSSRPGAARGRVSRGVPAGRGIGRWRMPRAGLVLPSLFLLPSEGCAQRATRGVSGGAEES